MHRQGHSPEKIRMTSEGVSQSVFGKGSGDGGNGESHSVAFSVWCLAILQWEVLGENMEISLQGSSTKGYVVSAADFVIPPNEKGISEYNEFSPHSLCDYQTKPHLLFVSATIEQF